MDTRTECLQEADFRRRRRRLTIAIVAAFVAIDVVIWFGGFDRPGGWNAIDAFVVGSVACQICLLSVWVAFGEQYFFVRVLCVTPLCLLFAWLVADQEFTKEAWQTGGFMLLLLYFVGAIIPAEFCGCSTCIASALPRLAPAKMHHGRAGRCNFRLPDYLS